jgi:hypothetical protein
VQEKREALEEVVGSERFSRAEQLRNFLRYICEMELAGRGGELCEALIGVEALRRPADYTPTEDASVRRRASDLRERLQDVYATELAGSRVRIELPKGRYIPRFVRIKPESGADALQADLNTTPEAARSGRSQQSDGPVALSPLPERNVVATPLNTPAMETACFEPHPRWRRRPTIFLLSVGWVLGALTVTAGFTLALWLRPAPTETVSPRPAASLPVPLPAAAESGTNYEAEAPGNTFHQAVRSWPCDWCSGGARVRYIGKNPRNYLIMNNINVAKADNYEMIIFYLVEGTRTLLIRVNDGPATRLLLTGKGWRQLARVSITVPLRAGANKVKFYNDSSYAPDIDRIVIR